MRVRIVLAGAVVVAVIGWLAATGLGKNLTYFVTPGELLAKGTAAVGERLRLGGEVAPGSVRWDPTTKTLAFTMTDGNAGVPVINRGAPPALFRAGIGAVVEGIYGRDGIFRSDDVLIKHSAEYRPPSPGESVRPDELTRTMKRSGDRT